MAKDPVCGMRVDETKSVHKAVYHGTTYYFCSEDCRKAFELTPEKYVNN